MPIAARQAVPCIASSGSARLAAQAARLRHSLLRSELSSVAQETEGAKAWKAWRTKRHSAKAACPPTRASPPRATETALSETHTSSQFTASILPAKGITLGHAARYASTDSDVFTLASYEARCSTRRRCAHTGRARGPRTLWIPGSGVCVLACTVWCCASDQMSTLHVDLACQDLACLVGSAVRA